MLIFPFFPGRTALGTGGGKKGKISTTESEKCMISLYPGT